MGLRPLRHGRRRLLPVLFHLLAEEARVLRGLLLDHGQLRLQVVHHFLVHHHATRARARRQQGSHPRRRHGRAGRGCSGRPLLSGRATERAVHIALAHDGLDNALLALALLLEDGELLLGGLRALGQLLVVLGLDVGGLPLAVLAELPGDGEELLVPLLQLLDVAELHQLLRDHRAGAPGRVLLPQPPCGLPRAEAASPEILGLLEQHLHLVPQVRGLPFERPELPLGPPALGLLAGELGLQPAAVLGGVLQACSQRGVRLEGVLVLGALLRDEGRLALQLGDDLVEDGLHALPLGALAAPGVCGVGVLVVHVGHGHAVAHRRGRCSGRRHLREAQE
mmetsp:Transcript_16152/g.50783  ORF Transcript_16152/g.50783 Transcript_16152/m.50783 type:complete len:337 (-) Transcript_16152:1260-2270(-)